ncbi:phage holin family protein [Herbidospora sp. NEAU-GS84]|uniref:Phage holin family protein n=1 Tax=Herbidospora solisilvae TaxID=2696284 RepID=A0A7C9J8D6_9ACTN|nr:phage holin family protein [Herbidospora solisilvae]NAS22428.1 phage holin family protein [Herbidospora solisilvae]
MREDESLGALVAEASTHISTLVRAEIELAKSELKFDAKRVGMATGLFAAAAFTLHLVLILASFTIAYVLHDAVGLSTWLSFLIVTVFYLVTAGILGFVGYRRLQGLAGFKRTRRSLQNLKSTDETPHLEPVPTTPTTTAGEVGAHRATIAS